jgi:predicted transcriptional regulator
VESDVTRAIHTILINDWNTIIIVITYVGRLYAAEIGELKMNKFAQHLSTLICAALQVDDSADRQNKKKGVVFVRYFLTQCPGVIRRFFPFSLQF